MKKVLLLGDVTIEEYKQIEKALFQNGYILLYSKDADRWDAYNLIQECDAVVLHKYSKRDMNMVITCQKPILSKMNYESTDSL